MLAMILAGIDETVEILDTHFFQ
ncbi:MAG: hypothetical protein H6Q05_753, partial [Acidobacteria bacterium]|nr:hypothetical protein [Acidobacteriota bacterium]